MTVLSLVDRVRRACDRWGVEVALLQSDGLGEHGAGGWFNEDAKRIEIAVRMAGWVECLAHEFGHVQQWAEGVFVDGDTREGYDRHEAWLSGSVEASAAQVRRWFRAIQSCERDAERRAIAILVEEDLTSGADDVARYIRGANTYVLAYEAARLLRKWPRRSTSNATLVAKMPATFIEDLAAIPPGAMRLYAACARGAK